MIEKNITSRSKRLLIIILLVLSIVTVTGMLTGSFNKFIDLCKGFIYCQGSLKNNP